MLQSKGKQIFQRNGCCRNAFSKKIQKSRCFRVENSGIWFLKVQELLFPVVPDVLHIVVIFHDVDELFHQLIRENEQIHDKNRTFCDKRASSVGVILPVYVTMDSGTYIITKQKKESNSPLKIKQENINFLSKINCVLRWLEHILNIFFEVYSSISTSK